METSTPTLQKRSRAPYPQSLLAFLTAAWPIIEGEEPPRLSTKPSTEWLDAYGELTRPILVTGARLLEEAALQMLASAGLPPRLLVAPYSPTVRALIDQMQLGYRSAIQLRDSQVDGLALPKIKTSWAIIGAASARARAESKLSSNAVHESVAKLLNTGIPRKDSTRYSIDRDHVRRAEKAYLEAIVLRAWMKGGSAKVQHAYEHLETEECLDRFDALMSLHGGAKKLPSYRDLHGYELARVLHRDYDLCAGVHLVLSGRTRLPRIG
jgi:hypothetical protein